MKNEFYKLLKKDLNEIVNKNDYSIIVENLKSIISEIENLEKIYPDKILEEDIKIIISKYYINSIYRIKEKPESEFEKTELEELKTEIKIYEKYFESQEECESLYERESYSFGDIKEVKRILDFVNKESNGVSQAFKAFAILLIITGIIQAIVMANLSGDFSTFIIILVMYVFSTLLLYGFAELFQILHDIRKKLYIKK